MRKFLILPGISLCLTLTVSAQDIDKMPIVNVTGTAEVLVVPDEVIFSLDVRKLNMDLQAAKRESDTT
jgi:uncharacterized protein YggE